VDDATVVDSVVVVESRAATLTPVPAGSNDPRSNDLVQPIARGLIAADDVAEIGELVAGTRAGHTSPEQITLYKSVGVAAQDVSPPRSCCGPPGSAASGAKSLSSESDVA
jgi:ornithine cyclodeaminase/alanine dehydrogenase-like protein (mu-crystallin family)